MVGTFVLLFIGCGTGVFSGAEVGNVGIALAFGLALMAMIYAVGPVSGAHLNPAVTLAVYAAGRMKGRDVFGYIVFQLLGALLACSLITLIAYGNGSNFYPAVDGLAENGWGEGYAGGYNLLSAVLFEFIATFIFINVILRTTAAELKIAGVVIGLTLAVVHILGLPITGVSVNPARSFAPAVFVGGTAWNQLWMFLLVPSVAGLLAGLGCRFCNCDKECKK